MNLEQKYNYVNLYLKSEYSLLSSTCKINDTIYLAQKYNYKTLAITDESNMHGAIKFYKKCKDNDIKPIIGLKIKYKYNDQISSLLLYAINKFGYQNLMKICSRGKINSGIVDFEYLEKTNLGIICIIPSSENHIYNLLLSDINENIAINHYKLLKSVYQDVYLGISKTNDYERRVYHDIAHRVIKNKIDAVGIIKTEILNESERIALRVLEGIKNNKEINQETEVINNIFHSESDLIEEFKDYDFLLKNTIKIANKCNLSIEFDKYQYPKYPNDVDNKIYLSSLSKKGLEKRLNSKKKSYNLNEYYTRLHYELSIINDMGYSDYFLIVWDFIKYAKKNNILVGPGRGSAAGSLVAYSLGITDVDPLEYGLIFERFLNKERISMPDIDTDFQDDRREEVIKYVGSRYGKSRVAHIVTFGRFASKLAIRESARILKLSSIRLEEVSKHISSQESLQSIVNTNVKLQELMNTYDDINDVVNVALKLEGLPRNTSTHAAGIIITRDDLTSYTPVEEGLDDIYQTQYDATDLESLGLLKLDFLGLRNLTNISKCINLIKEVEPDFILPKEYNDASTYRIIANGDVQGIFQLESEGMRNTLMQMKVSNLDDIIQSIALYRPGPMEMIPTFISRKFSKEKIDYIHKDLEPILKETYGIIVYQEQIMMIARKIANYSLGEADILRRAISKKKASEMAKIRDNFIQSAMKNSYSKEISEKIFEYIDKFANYGFNKSHSVSYAIVAYITAYLKNHYFAFYLAVLMTSVIGSEKLLNNYYKEAINKKIDIYNPNIEYSNTSFRVVKKGLVLPLILIEGLGEVKVNQLIEKRPYESFEDFIIKTKDILTPTLIENIIYSCALDHFGLTKKAMIDTYGLILGREKYKHVSNLSEITYTEEEFEYGYLLEKEKMVLGVNIKYNFFHRFQNIYYERNLVKIAKININKPARTLGIIKNIKEIVTKNNEKMAFALLEDDTSSIELVIFPSIYREMDIKNEKIVQVYGNIQVSKKNDKILQLIVNKII